PALQHEAALRARRDYQRVLDGLGLHETQDLRPEVLGPVARADAAARDLPAAEVDPLHDRTVDPDLVQGMRLRELAQVRGADLEGDPVDVGGAREEARADRRLDDVAERAEERVLAERRDGVEAREELLPGGVRVGPRRTRLEAGA